MATRARRRCNRTYNEPLIQPGEHYTLHYKQTTTGEDNFSSVAEILHWIETGPFLQPPVGPVTANQTDAPPITTPSYVPAKVQYVPNLAPPSLASSGTVAASPTVLVEDTGTIPQGQRVSATTHKRRGPHARDGTTRHVRQDPDGAKKVSDWTVKRVSLPDWTEKGCLYRIGQKKGFPSLGKLKARQLHAHDNLPTM
jgi:hypothetical protein